MRKHATETVKLPPRLAEFRRARFSKWGLALVIAGAAGLAVLFLFNPAQYAIYPRCAFYLLTGWQCPGCGGLRAMHQFLHGHWAAAWALNPLAVLLVPGFLWLGVHWALRLRSQNGLPMPRFDGRAAWICVAGLVVFGVFRNL